MKSVMETALSEDGRAFKAGADPAAGNALMRLSNITIIWVLACSLVSFPETVYRSLTWPVHLQQASARHHPSCGYVRAPLKRNNCNLAETDFKTVNCLPGRI